MLKSRSQASAILSRQRRLSIGLAQKISATWSIPIQLLVRPYKLHKVAA